MGKGWKHATITLSVILALSVTVIIIMGVIFGEEMKVAGIVEGGFKGAVNNDAMCHDPGVHCTFVPDPSVTPPPIDNPGHKYSVDTAAFGAQLVATLEAAKNSNKAPLPLPNTMQLALLSTNSDKNIAWVVQTTDLQQVWVVFRGTQTETEWKQDMDWKQAAWDDSGEALVHHGFLNIYHQLKTPIRQAIVAAKITTGVLFITGHSLGAALSLLCAADTGTDMVVPDTRVYIFAPPRTGNKAFMKLVQASKLLELYCLGNHTDVVPTLPLAVTPNFTNYADPWMYAQFPLMMFYANWGSITYNHTMPCYIAHLNMVTLCL